MTTTHPSTEAVISIKDQLEEASRTLEQRRRDYAKAVNEGRMNSDTASRRIKAMEAIVSTVARALDFENLSKDLAREWSKENGR